MGMLILGLVIFLGVHSTRILADDWRAATILRVGKKGWKGLYALLTLLAFISLAAAYGPCNAIQARRWPWW